MVNRIHNILNKLPYHRIYDIVEVCHLRFLQICKKTLKQRLKTKMTQNNPKICLKNGSQNYMFTYFFPYYRNYDIAWVCHLQSLLS